MFMEIFNIRKLIELDDSSLYFCVLIFSINEHIFVECIKEVTMLSSYFTFKSKQG